MFRHSVAASEDIASFYDELVDQHHLDFVQPALTIVRSVIAEGAADQLAAHTSMHDLVVTTVPVPEKPDRIRVAPTAKDGRHPPRFGPDWPGRRDRATDLRGATAVLAVRDREVRYPPST